MKEGGGPNKPRDATKHGGMEQRNYQKWIFENPQDLQTKEVRGSTMQWYKNDCHEKPMWYGRKNCLGKADFSKIMHKRKEEKSVAANSKNDFSGDFKIALATMTSVEDFKSLSGQFLSGKSRRVDYRLRCGE